MPDRYTDEERARIRRRLARGATPLCPRCEVALERRDVPPRREVAYVRDRIWTVCGECGRSEVFDRRKLDE